MRSYAVTHPRNVGIPTRRFSEWDAFTFASRGVLTVTTGAGVWVVPPGRAVWIPAGGTHAVATSGRVTLRTLFFRPELSARRLPRHPAALTVSSLVRELVLHAAARNTLSRDCAADRRLAAVIIDQLELLPVAPLELPMPRDERARLAARHIEQRPISPLATVARTAGASRRTLERLFQDETGMPLGRWRRRARLIAALKLLADGAPVTVVSDEVGYASASAFVAAFRRELGTTPARYFSERYL